MLASSAALELLPLNCCPWTTALPVLIWTERTGKTRLCQVRRIWRMFQSSHIVCCYILPHLQRSNCNSLCGPSSTLTEPSREYLYHWQSCDFFSATCFWSKVNISGGLLFKPRHHSKHFFNNIQARTFLTLIMLYTKYANKGIQYCVTLIKE